MLQTQTNIAAGFTIKRREGASLRRQAATISNGISVRGGGSHFLKQLFGINLSLSFRSWRPNSLPDAARSQRVTHVAPSAAAQRYIYIVVPLVVILLRRWWCDESGHVGQPRPVVRKMELKDSLVSMKIIGCNKATG